MTGFHFGAINANAAYWYRFDRANLYNADLSDAEIVSATRFVFTGANLTCATVSPTINSQVIDWTDAICPDGTPAAPDCAGKFTRAPACP